MRSSALDSFKSCLYCRCPSCFFRSYQTLTQLLAVLVELGSPRRNPSSRVEAVNKQSGARSAPSVTFWVALQPLPSAQESDGRHGPTAERQRGAVTAPHGAAGRTQQSLQEDCRRGRKISPRQQPLARRGQLFTPLPSTTSRPREVRDKPLRNG